ncbi:GNAT family N-acetyltransferase [Paenibacillus agilis]|uniref:GNAT family N-acetyltransferase n=1 Tax=Paenibacillus agilis TaxID=3020863 RepID=A0A559J1E5_9BACL|nr:GNAT family N-acetyltransferase [Paenibacillus agilis]TVX93697.1 GNAT family N-acetyltransferase [Paenibacillus agilis]
MSSVVNLVTYHPDYADSIAEMWNRSQDHWGGNTSIYTGAQVRAEEENSDALIVFLAVCDEQVVGYCSVCEYREDTGALYINFLNVRPDYHGHKIGKQLVLRAVEETIQRGWPRIDLYTWESNMKAVPLYKKCGFFWEDREDTTHFMNFIPQIMNCEALAPYMEGIDWYNDSTRTIEVKRDGQETNGFHTYTYSWSKGNRNVRVDIERRGRGICLIETDDYKISAEVDQAKPVFGKAYSIQYKLENKSGVPLRIELVGENDRNIEFDWQNAVDVEAEQSLTASFFVGAIEDEQSDWRTCPTVRTRIRINGAEALLQVGVVPKHPAKVVLQSPDILHAVGGKYTFYLDIESHMSEPADFLFELPEVPWLNVEERAFRIRLEAKERASLPIPYCLLDYGFYETKLTVRALPDNGPEVEFYRWIGGRFCGPGAMITGMDNDAHWAVNGKYVLKYDKEDSNIFIECIGKPNDHTIVLYPRIGKPYASEFSKKSPVFTEWLEERGAVGFKHIYHSDAYPGIILYNYALVYGDGTVKLWQELENTGDTATSTSLMLSQRIVQDMHRVILPYEGRYMETTNSLSSDYDYWDGSKMTEPWIYARRSSTGIGLCWTDSYQMNFGDWFTELEYDIGRLESVEKRSSEVITLSIGGFDDWKAFRAYALKCNEDDSSLQLTSDIEFIANGGNSFIDSSVSEVQVKLNDVKQNVWDGEVSAGYLDKKGTCQVISSAELSDEDEASEVEMRVPALTDTAQLLEVSAKIGPLQAQYHSILFPVSTEPIRERIYDRDGFTLHESFNGRIRLEAANDYYPGLCTLEVDGQTWLASALPNYEPKSWWNPWLGGMSDSFADLHVNSVLKADRETSFVKMKDSVGNLWSGIRISFQIKEHETYKGLTWNGYYLMLPNVPVLAYVSDIHQDTDTYWNGKAVTTDLWLNTNAEQSAWLRTFQADGETIYYRLGAGELDVNEYEHYAVGMGEGGTIMHVVTDELVLKPHLYSNPDITDLSFARSVNLANGSVQRSTPVFFAFHEQLLPRTALAQLRNLTFPQPCELDDKGV